MNYDGKKVLQRKLAVDKTGRSFLADFENEIAWKSWPFRTEAWTTIRFDPRNKLLVSRPWISPRNDSQIPLGEFQASFRKGYSKAGFNRFLKGRKNLITRMMCQKVQFQTRYVCIWKSGQRTQILKLPFPTIGNPDFLKQTRDQPARRGEDWYFVRFLLACRLIYFLSERSIIASPRRRSSNKYSYSRFHFLEVFIFNNWKY